MQKQRIIEIIKNNRILFFVLLQPLLDVLAFWTQSESGTIAGIIRLLMMVGVYIFAFYKRRTPSMWLFSGILIFVFGLHILNSFRIGYTGMVADFQYIARAASMPVLAISFCALADDVHKQNQIVKGIYLSAFITGIVIILSAATHTYMPTYVLEHLGISGWVTENNRCCHSDILSSLAVFTAFGAFSTRVSWIKFILPLLIFAAMITNATTSCYLTLLAITAGFPIFMALRSFLLKKKNNRFTNLLIIEFAVLFAVTLMIYPFTPRCKMEELKNAAYNNVEQKFVEDMADLGYSIYDMTLEEKMSDPVVHEKLTVYYAGFISHTVESMRYRFGIDRVIRAMDGIISAEVLDDARVMKRLNASFIFEDSDFQTRLFGFEFGNIHHAYEDLENDWDAIYYYYGYVGIASYIFVTVYLFLRIIRILILRFRESLTPLNFTLFFCFVLQIGLAGFSGALLRRPNASIYLSLVIAQIWYWTKLPSVENSSSL
ncbi:MAG: O-antigen ligase family protein [Oscillospiraceae bacterium]|nr:O-antigen ligase family protein [Oscillospiraceae bacterium]MBQ4454986.1 O-antigen ligase family protein [Clostridia bacterium]